MIQIEIHLVGTQSINLPENSVDVAFLVQTYHALGLMFIGLIGFHVHQNVIMIPALMITAGIIIFSGSLYILVLSGVRWLGSITPIGGLSFIAGWVLLAVNLIRN